MQNRTQELATSWDGQREYVSFRASNDQTSYTVDKSRLSHHSNQTAIEFNPPKEEIWRTGITEANSFPAFKAK